METKVRPRSIAEIGDLAHAPGWFDLAVREFLDAWQEMNTAERSKAGGNRRAVLCL